MHASDIMTRDVQACSPDDGLDRAAKIMWDRDCGVVPVVDSSARVVGIITDRDIAMAAFTQGRPIAQIPVSTAMARDVSVVQERDPTGKIEALMRHARVHRIPVVDQEGRLKGIVSMNDLLRQAHGSSGRAGNSIRSDSVLETLAVVRQPHAPQGSSEASDSMWR